MNAPAALPLSYGSVCSGIEAVTVAMTPLGWQAAWYAEIASFPCALLANYYPATPNLGDMTTIAVRLLTGKVMAPEVLVGGTPCQAFSVAGARQSLADQRGSLTLRYVELADAIDFVRRRAGQPAAVVWWENVPGVLSTPDNAFGCFLARLAGEHEPLHPLGKRWTNAGAVYGSRRAIAWRTLDAQYFGLAQRRRRVFVIASARKGFDPTSVLFEWERVRRDSAPRRTAGQSPADRVGAGADGDDGARVAGALSARMSVTQQDAESGHLVVTTPTDVPAVSLCLNAGGMGRSDSESETLIPVAFNWQAGQGPASLGYAPKSGVNGTLSVGQTPAIAFTKRACDPEPITLAVRRREGGRHVEYRQDGAANALLTPHGGQSGMGVGAIAHACTVRRLTPRECERLQGFPDDYTRITVRGKPAADAPRYKALGNSMAVPVIRWIGTRIDAALRELARHDDIAASLTTELKP